MATIIGVTALPLTKEQQQQLCAGVAKGVCDAFHLDINVSSMMLLPSLPPSATAPASPIRSPILSIPRPTSPTSKSVNWSKMYMRPPLP